MVSVDLLLPFFTHHIRMTGSDSLCSEFQNLALSITIRSLPWAFGFALSSGYILECSYLMIESAVGLEYLFIYVLSSSSGMAISEM